MPDFLLEIGCEEIPARMIDAASQELRERVGALLNKQHVMAAVCFRTCGCRNVSPRPALRAISRNSLKTVTRFNWMPLPFGAGMPGGKSAQWLGVAGFCKWAMFTWPSSIDLSVSSGTTESLPIFV